MFRNYRIAICLLGTICLGACSDSLVQAPDLPIGQGVSLHTRPSWYNDESIVFHNIGAVAIGEDWLHVREEYVGITFYNLATNVFEVIVQGGDSPAANSDSIFCSILGTSLIVGTFYGWEVIDESIFWPLRVDLGISHDGTMVAWTALSNEPEKGIWILNLQNMEYTFVELGYFPAWHPSDNKIVFRTEGGEEGEFAVEYDFQTGESDTLFHFVSFTGYDFSYSPFGDKLAFFGGGLNPDDSGVYILDIQSEEVQQINNHVGTGLSWGKSGLVYSRECGFEDLGCGVLWVADDETWECRQLTERFQFVTEEDN